MSSYCFDISSPFVRMWMVAGDLEKSGFDVGLSTIAEFPPDELGDL